MLRPSRWLTGSTEVVKKSITDGDVRSAYYAATRTPMTEPTSPSPYVEAVLIDEGAVVVCEGEKKYKVPFTLTEGEITFQRDQATEVALTWAEKRAVRKRDPWLVGGVASASKALQRYTLGCVYAPGEVDAHGDFMTEEEIERSAWAALGTEVGLMHEPGTAGAGKVVESYVHRGKAFTMKDVSGKAQTIPTGAWLLGVVWTPEAWKLVESGKITGYSLQGTARSVEPSDEDEPEEKRKTAVSFANVVYGITERTRDFDPAELERTHEETFSPASAAEREEQERVGRALTEWSPDAEPNLRDRRPRVSFSDLFTNRERAT